MRRRPWPIVILALLQLLLPAFTILLASTFYSMDPSRYLRVLYYLKSQMDFYLFFVLPLVAALAIFVVRKWSYPLFIATMIWTLYNDLSHWTMSSTVFPTMLLICTYVFNILLVSYLMVPAVWALYFNPKFAWWRSQPRYIMNHLGHLKVGHRSLSCRVLDVSQGGAFIELDEKLDVRQQGSLEFEYGSISLKLPVQITHAAVKDGRDRGYGIRFGRMDSKSLKSLKEVIRSLKKLNLAQVTDEMLRKEGFVAWLVHLVKTGHGLVPLLPSPVKRDTRL